MMEYIGKLDYDDVKRSTSTQYYVLSDYIHGRRGIIILEYGGCIPRFHEESNTWGWNNVTSDGYLEAEYTEPRNDIAINVIDQSMGFEIAIGVMYFVTKEKLLRIIKEIDELSML